MEFLKDKKGIIYRTAKNLTIAYLVIIIYSVFKPYHIDVFVNFQVLSYMVAFINLFALLIYLHFEGYSKKLSTTFFVTGVPLFLVGTLFRSSIVSNIPFSNFIYFFGLYLIAASLVTDFFLNSRENENK